jgi:hypothetical protein
MDVPDMIAALAEHAPAEGQQIPADWNPEGWLVAVDDRDALAYVIVRPGSEPDAVLVEAATPGLRKPDAARVLRNTADQWDPQAGAAEQAPAAPDTRTALDRLAEVYGEHGHLPGTARTFAADLLAAHRGEVLREAAKQAEPLAVFARRVIALDDPSGPGATERRTVTLNRIIGWAHEALGDQVQQ